MRDGTTHTGRCEVTKGEPANPHSPADLQGKFFRLGTPIWGEANTRKLFEGCMGLERIPDFRAFADTLAL